MTEHTAGPQESPELATTPQPTHVSLTAGQREMLLESPLLQGVPYASVFDWLHYTPVLVLQRGETLIESGVPHGKLFLVVSGQLSVWLDPTPELPDESLAQRTMSGPEVARIFPGQSLGEQGLIDGQPPSVWAIAARESRVLAIPTDMAWQTMQVEPKIALNLLRMLSDRMRQANDGLRGAIAHQQRLARDADTDALTGLHNRRWMENMFPRTLQRFQMSERPVSLLMVDIDFFKRVNDEHGHAVGDQVLRESAQRMLRMLRPSDLCARFGGEEFCILLPELDADQATAIAQRVLAAFNSEPLDLDSGAKLKISVSIGVTDWDHLVSVDDLIRAADNALYQAKRDGRNRVVTAHRKTLSR